MRIIHIKLLTIILIFAASGIAYAHGVDIRYDANLTYEIYATFDNGEPIKGGQVTVYAPDNPTEPWDTGITDEQGRYLFIPDNIEGNWTIKIRQAGHGSSVNIPIGTDSSSLSGDTGLSASQIILMSISVIWGSIGTALYFRRRRQ